MAPFIKTYTPTTTIKSGFRYQYNFSGYDVDGHALTFKAVVPNWLMFSADSNFVNTATLTGVPGAAEIGVPQTVTVYVSNGIMTTQYSFTINVTQ